MRAMQRLRYAVMSSERTLFMSSFCCALLCAGCSSRHPVARYEGIDPGGEYVDVSLYIPPFIAATPVCLAPAVPGRAEFKMVARPPAATRRDALYLSRRHYSECGPEIFANVVYWETTPQGPEVCFFRVRSQADAGADVLGAWDYCTVLQPYRD